MTIHAIVGSRNYLILEHVRKWVNMLPDDTIVLSGGARGVDTTAIEAAQARGLETIVLEADWKHGGDRAGLSRNVDIAKQCDLATAFWDGCSTGTVHVIKQIRKLGKEVKVWKTEHPTVRIIMHQPINFGWEKGPSTHMVISDEDRQDPLKVEQFMQFAYSIGMQARWLQKAGKKQGKSIIKYDHFDLTVGKYQEALKRGATVVSVQEFVTLCRGH